MIKFRKKLFARFPYNLNPVEKSSENDQNLIEESQSEKSIVLLEQYEERNLYHQAFQKIKNEISESLDNESINVERCELLLKKLLKMSFYTRKIEEFNLIKKNLDLLNIDNLDIFFHYTNFFPQSKFPDEELKLMTDNTKSNNEILLRQNIKNIILPCNSKEEFLFRKEEIKINLKSFDFPLGFSEDFSKFLSHLNNYFFFIVDNKKKLLNKTVDEVIDEEIEKMSENLFFGNFKQKLNLLIQNENVLEMFVTILNEKFKVDFLVIFEEDFLKDNFKNLGNGKNSDFFLILNFVDFLLESKIFSERAMIILNSVFSEIQKRKLNKIFKTRVWFLYAKYFLSSNQKEKSKKLFYKILDNEFKPYDNGIIRETYFLILRHFCQNNRIKNEFEMKYKTFIFEEMYIMDDKTSLKNLFNDSMTDI